MEKSRLRASFKVLLRVSDRLKRAMIPAETAEEKK